jgi:hypothetical protein
MRQAAQFGQTVLLQELIFSYNSHSSPYNSTEFARDTE